MKKLIIIILSVICIPVMSCSSSDDSDDGGGTQTVNIKYEVITSRNSSAIITITLNNETQTDEVDNLPYDRTYTQTDVNDGTYVKLTYLEDGTYAVGPDGSSWTDYTADLKIYVDNEVVQSESFAITEGASAVKTIDYTFD